MAIDRALVLERAHGFVQKGQWESAVELMEQAHVLDRSDPIVTLRLGDLYKKLDRKRAAAEFYCKTADIFAATNQTTKAAATYKMVLRLHPQLDGVEEKLAHLTARHDAARRGQGIELSNAAPAAAIELGSAYKDTGDPVSVMDDSGPEGIFYGSSEKEETADEPDIPHETIPGLVELGSTVGRLVSASDEEGIPVDAGIDLSAGTGAPRIESFAMNNEEGRSAPGTYPAANLPETTSSDIFDDFAADVAAPAPAARAPRGAHREIKFLTDLAEDELWELLGRMDRLTFGPDEFIIREGEEGDSLYIITSGRVLVTTTKNGMRIRLAELGENDFFGEVSFLTGQPRSADITAIETTTVMEFKRFEMDELIKKYPNVERVLWMFQKDRVADTMSTIMTISEGML